MPARWRAVLVAVGVAACSSRPHVGDRGAKDAAPAVVVVERPRSPLPTVPLVDEVEPNGDLAHAQTFEYPKGIRGHLAPAVGDPEGKPRGGMVGDEDLYQW